MGTTVGYLQVKLLYVDGATSSAPIGFGGSNGVGGDYSVLGDGFAIYANATGFWRNYLASIALPTLCAISPSGAMPFGWSPNLPVKVIVGSVSVPYATGNTNISANVTLTGSAVLANAANVFGIAIPLNGVPGWGGPFGFGVGVIQTVSTTQFKVLMGNTTTGGATSSGNTNVAYIVFAQ